MENYYNQYQLAENVLENFRHHYHQMQSKTDLKDLEAKTADFVKEFTQSFHNETKAFKSTDKRQLTKLIIERIPERIHKVRNVYNGGLKPEQQAKAEQQKIVECNAYKLLERQLKVKPNLPQSLSELLSKENLILVNELLQQSLIIDKDLVFNNEEGWNKAKLLGMIDACIENKLVPNSTLTYQLFTHRYKIKIANRTIREISATRKEFKDIFIHDLPKR